MSCNADLLFCNSTHNIFVVHYWLPVEFLLLLLLYWLFTECKCLITKTTLTRDEDVLLLMCKKAMDWLRQQPVVRYEISSNLLFSLHMKMSERNDKQTGVVGGVHPGLGLHSWYPHVDNTIKEVKLVDVPEMGYFSTDTPPTGELLIRGACVTPGYYKVTRVILNEEIFLI